ncbi:MAG TPA: thiamine-phosphate kinase [Gammaproteobacteria bacterium]
MSGQHHSFAASLLSTEFAGGLRLHPADTGFIQWDSSESIAIAVDSLVENIHFRNSAAATDVAWKALAINLSDLAAMGAMPKTAAVVVQWPQSRRSWLTSFGRGFELAAAAFSVEVVAASTIDGPGIVTVEVCGSVPSTRALTRRGARAGDVVYVTGTLGDAGLGLRITQGKLKASDADEEFLLARLDRPTPRITAGIGLRGIASAAIDISDGLAGDLGHIISISNVGARIELEKLPCSAPLQRSLGPPDAWYLAASAGDDYEICFVVPPGQERMLESVCHQFDVEVTQIGVIEGRPGLRFVNGDGSVVDAGGGFDHFAGNG